jgi:hypothetical protein
VQGILSVPILNRELQLRLGFKKNRGAGASHVLCVDSARKERPSLPLWQHAVGGFTCASEQMLQKLCSVMLLSKSGPSGKNAIPWEKAWDVKRTSFPRVSLNHSEG